jgi:hypothetical protein
MADHDKSTRLPRGPPRVVAKGQSLSSCAQVHLNALALSEYCIQAIVERLQPIHCRRTIVAAHPEAMEFPNDGVLRHADSITNLFHP